MKFIMIKKRVYLCMAITFSSLFLMVGCSNKDTTKPKEHKMETQTEDSGVTQETISLPTTLSEDIFSFQIKFDETIFPLPCRVNFFLEQGFTTTDDLNTSIEPNNYHYATLTKDNLTISVGFFNGGINTTPLSQSLISTLEIKEEALSSTTKITLPKGILVGTSTKEDILKAYGSPSETRETDSFITLNYYRDYYEEINLLIKKDTNILSGISIQNIKENKKQNEKEIKNVSKEVPKEILSYTAPTTISDNFLDFDVEYNGKLYRIPAPLSEFLKNGWELDDTSDKVVKSGSYGFAYLKKGEYLLSTVVENPSDLAVTIENSFVTLLKADLTTAKVPITISKGITCGMNRGDLLIALSGTKFEHEETKDLETYTLRERESNNYLQIAVNKGNAQVSSIELSNTTK